MSRLPTPGADSGTWGDILNDYLAQALDPNGSLKAGSVGSTQLQDNSVTSAAIAPAAVTADVLAPNAVDAVSIADGSITEALLDAGVQAKLNTAGSGNVADGTITTAKLHDDAVTDAKVSANAAIAKSKLAALNIGDADVGTISQSKITNLTSDLAGKAATLHTHTASQISDSTAIGRSLLAAADATAAKSALSLVQSDVGLSNVDNTSDATKNSASVTLTNKTLDNSTTLTIKDANLTIQDDSDTTKQAKFQVSGITTGNTRTYTLPDSTGTLALTSLMPPIRFSAPTAVTGVTPTDYAFSPRNLTGARMRVASAPAGSSLSVQVQHWDGFSWNTIGTLTIADGSVTESVVSFSCAQTTGNMVRLNVTSVGSNSAATGVAVDVVVG